MSDVLIALVEKARLVRMTPDEMDEQRISFAFGNAHLEDPRVTREAVARVVRAHPRLNRSMCSAIVDGSTCA